MAILRAAVLLAFAVACGDDTALPPASLDPFVPSAAMALEEPGREIAVETDGARTVIFVPREFPDDVVALGLEGRSWSTLSSVAVAGGPRAICSVGGEIVVASTGSSTVTRLSFDGANLVEREAVDPGGPPVDVACADEVGGELGEVAAIVGLEEEAAIVFFDAESLAELEKVPFPSASHLGFVDIDGDEDLDVVALATSANTAAFLTKDGASHALARTSETCAAPRAHAAIAEQDGSVTLAIACDGAVELIARPLDDEASEEIEAPPRLYDLVSGDLDADGVADLAAVGIGDNGLTVWFGREGGAFERFDHAVSRGPVALAKTDVGSDGDSDLLVLSFEGRRLMLFENGVL